MGTPGIRYELRDMRYEIIHIFTLQRNDHLCRSEERSDVGTRPPCCEGNGFIRSKNTTPARNGSIRSKNTTPRRERIHPFRKAPHPVGNGFIRSKNTNPCRERIHPFQNAPHP